MNKQRIAGGIEKPGNSARGVGQMKLDLMVAESPNRGGVRLASGLVAATVVAALLLMPMAANAGGGSAPAGPSTAVKFEKIPGTHVKRVILTAKAAERLGVETAKIGEQQIIRKQMVGGQVTHPLRIEAEQKQVGGFGGFAQPAVVKAPAPAIKPKPGESWVRMALSEEEWGRVAKDKPARLLPLATRPGLKKEVSAMVSKLPPIADRKRSMLNVYYVVDGKDHGLKVNERMRIELTLKGDSKKRMVAPYSAVYYDGKGEPWVYTVPKKLVYERKPVKVERVVGGMAVLTAGPPVGTEIVTVGSSLLFGAEVIYKR
ncbi:MAG: hypothetical protein ACR2PO_06660 [Methyloligellaceae bacterium]